MANQSTNSQNQHEESLDKDLLHPIWGANSAVKIYQALEIGKIKFSFFEKEDPTHSIDCYMDVIDFVSDFIDQINSGELMKRCAYARKEQAEKGAKYAADIWESRAGVAQNKEQIRKFSIQPGSKQELAFRAQQNGKNIVIGFSFRELKNLAYKWSFLEKDWNKIMEGKYNLASMTSEYHAKKNKEQYEAQQREEEDLPIAVESHAVASNQAPSKSAATPNFEVSADDDLPVAMTPTKAQIAPESKENETIEESIGEPEKQANSSSEKPQNTQPAQAPMKSMNLKVKTALCDTNTGGKAFQGWSQDNKVYNVIIPKNLIDKGNAAIKKMLDDASKPGTMMTVFGGVKDQYIIVA